MAANIKRIRIFAASPGDVADERKRLDAVVAHLRTHVAAPHGLDLELVRWETHVRPGIAEDAQAVVNPQIGAYDLFIGILWNRFGTPTGRAESGTREEFDQAYARWQRDPGSLEIWMYFSEQPAAFATMAELEQKGKVLAFRQELQTKKGALTWPYRDPDDFETQVRGHLEDFVARFAARAGHAELDTATPALVSKLPAALAPLRDELARRFTKEELRGLCFDLGVEYDDLPSTTKTGQAQDLILYLERAGRLAELLALCRRLRPAAKWDELTTDRPPSAPIPDLAPMRERYLREVWDACFNLKLTSIDIKAATGRGETSELALNAVFTDLDVLEPIPSEEMASATARGAKTERRERADNRLPALSALSKHPRLVLLGDPGSGKSTLVSFVALCLAGEELGLADANIERLGGAWRLPVLLPVRMILRDYAARGLPQDKGIWQFIQSELSATPNSAGGSLAACIPAIEAALGAENGALLLLDGVDEVPEAHNWRAKLKEKIEQFCRDFPRCRVIVTSRPYAYGGDQPRLTGFEVRTLADFSPEQVQTFIQRWYAHVGQRDHALGSVDAERYAKQLQMAVKQNPRLADLAPRPLLLTLMASLHRWRQGGSLPEKRQELYEASVGLLLDLWQRPKQIFDAQGQQIGTEYDVWRELGIGADTLRRALELVAYEAHLNQPTTEGTHDIRARDLVGALYERSDKAKTGATADAGERRIVAYLTDRAGLLIERQQGEVYTFPHRTFQEYLAACFLADTDFPFLLAELLRQDDGRWREASLLAAARAVTGSPAPIWNLVAGFCPHDAPTGQAGSLHHITDMDWYASLRAAQALIETEKHLNVPERQKPLVERLRRWLVALIEASALPPAERAAAGDALARLDDPRPGVRLPPADIPDIAWCEVLAGPFIMGSTDDSESFYGKETPQRTIDLPAYRISKYLITNAQYDAFVRDGGYTAKRWRDCWTAAGLKWKGDRTEPERFSGAFDLPNHPVVAVTWYEALAFCGWLSEKLGHPVTLPTEAQWEKAARGPTPIPDPSPVPTEEGRLPSPAVAGEGQGGGRYPWGNDEITPQHANYAETGIGATSAVGVFPLGASPCGALDMSGNVWEWCLTQWREDYTTPANEGPAGDTARVLRGGAYYVNARRVRCASRYRDYPSLWLGDLGFRVVAPPVIHDSGL